MTELAALFDTARARLVDAPQDTLGEWRTPRRILGFGGDPKIVPAGSAWHVGVLLIGEELVAGVGEVLRSAEPVRRGYTAESARERAAVRSAAFRGGNAAGTVVHVGWEPLDLDAVAAGGSSGPLTMHDGVPMVRWSAGGGLTPLAPYLRERIDLLLHGAGA